MMTLLPDEDPRTKIRSVKSDAHWPSILQFGFSLISILVLWGFSIALGMMVLSSFWGTTTSEMTGDPLPLLLMAAGIAFGGILLIPSAGYALFRLLDKPVPIKLKLPNPRIFFIFIPLFIFLGYFAAKNTPTSWFSLPFIHVITAGLSILWVSSLGIRYLTVGSPQRVWGIFSAGLVAAPVLSLLTELIVIFGVGMLGISYLARDPIFAQKIIQFSENYIVNPNQPMDQIIDFLEPYLIQPAIIYFGLFIAAVLVPLIEEFFKPIGVWLLVGKKLTPAQGFAAGVLSGAGFALFENFTLSASSGEEWALVALARIGTSIIHVLTTGLTGWALACAWQEGRYLRLGLTYLTAVSIHALWNGLVILSVIPEILPDVTVYPQLLQNIGTTSPIVLLILLSGCFVLLLRFNKSLRHAIMPPVKHSPQIQSQAMNIEFNDTQNPSNSFNMTLTDIDKEVNP